MNRIIGFICLLVLSTPLWATQEWESVEKGKVPGDVSTWVRAVEGAQVKEFRGEVELPHAPLQVLLALDNVEDFTDWVYRCKRSERIVGKGVYMRFHGIWPVSDRDAVLQSTASIESDRVVIRTTVLEDVKPAEKHYVRIQALQNSFDVIPLANGGTKLIFQTFVDPGGILPAWISNVVAKDGPFETLTDLKKYLKHNPPATLSVDALSRIYDPLRGELPGFLQRLPAAP